MTSLIAWILAALAGVAAVALLLRTRGLSVELGQSGVENEKLRGELVASRAQLERAQAKHRRSGEELGELRKKLDKVKKRAARAQEGSKPASASQLTALEDELEKTRQARDAARDEAAALSAELSRVRAEAAAAASRQPEPEPEAPLLDNAGIQALQARLAESDRALSEAKPELAALEKANARLRGRLDTQEKLYVSIRSELEVKKDRLRTQQEEIERLRALKAAFVDPVPDPPSQSADEGRGPDEPAPSVAADEGAVQTGPAVPAPPLHD